MVYIAGHGQCVRLFNIEQKYTTVFVNMKKKFLKLDWKTLTCFLCVFTGKGEVLNCLNNSQQEILLYIGH